MSYRFLIKPFFRWVNLYGAPCICVCVCACVCVCVCVSEYETDSFRRIQSSPSPLGSDPDPAQSGLVEQKPIQSSPIRLVRTSVRHGLGWLWTGWAGKIWNNLKVPSSNIL